MGRQIVTLEVARLIQWIVLDLIILSSRRGANLTRWLWPYVTMVALQAKGWLFVITLWALLDLIFLHGQ